MGGTRRVAVGSLGGTITMLEGPDGAQPQLGAADLLGQFGDQLQAEAVTLERLPGASLTPLQLFKSVTWAAEQVAGGCDGAVLVQGTDTLPESAFLADLYWDGPSPLVVTGAMRLASALSADGPANVRDACLAASTPAVGAHGVVVCLGGQLHRADRVEKSHSWSTDAFTSGPAGLAGVVREGVVDLYAEGRATHGRSVAAPVGDPRVVLFKTYLGDDGRLLESVVRDDQVDGVVVEGFGVGHVPARVADVLAEAVSTLPVVVSTSAERGGTLSRTYGFPGSEMDLLERGVLLSRELSARKARLLMWAWLAQGASAEGRETLDALLGSY